MAVYVSHAIAGVTDDSIHAEVGPVEPPAVSLLANRLAVIGIESIRPITHNPWNPGITLAAQADLERLGHLPMPTMAGNHPVHQLGIDRRARHLADHQRGDIGVQEVLEFDLGIVARVTAVFSFLNPLSVGVSQEMVYACEHSVPVFGITVGNPVLSKWAIGHCTHIFEFDELLPPDNSDSLIILSEAYGLRKDHTWSERE